MTRCGCRAEKVRDSEGPLARPLQVAVKLLSPLHSSYGVEEVHVRAEHEANILEALKAKTLKNFSIPLHLLHLPPLDQPEGLVYIVMG